MHLTLAVPGLLALPADALAACAPLGRLACYARAQPATAGLAAATVAAVGAASDEPAPPSATAHFTALGAGLDPGDDHVLAADPVTLVADREGVSFAGIVTDLDAGESAALIDLLNRHFAQDGLRFAAPRPDAWFVRTAAAPALATTPTEALRGPLRALLPRGDDARTWQRWGNEIQMLLHEHAINAAREARGLATVTGVWFWGGATPAPPAILSDLAVFAVPGRPGDLARGLARHAGRIAHPLPPHAEAMFAIAGGAGRALVALAPVPDAETLTACSRCWLAPSLAALERGQLASLALVADGHGAATWRTGRPPAAARLKARFSVSRFTAPAPGDA